MQHLTYRRSRLAAMALAASATVAALGAAGGCSGAPNPTATPGTTTDPTLSPEESMVLERENRGTTPAEQFKIGQTLLITTTGPTPSTLVVIRNRELTIRNDTSVPQVLTFVNAEVDDKGGKTLGPIAPGEQLLYTPPFPISMAYTLDGDGVDGTLQVDVGDFSG